MKILIVSGNPRPNNHTKILAESYEREALKNGHEVKKIDVYSQEFVLPYTIAARLPDDDPSLPRIKASQELITWADEVVFFHPIWWSHMPAGLKNWIDSVITPNFAYKYVNGRPQALLSKKAKIFATAGSYAPYYLLPLVRLFTPLYIIWKYAILKFCGFDLIDFKVCDKMNVNNSQPPEGHFESFTRRVEYSAKFIH